MISWELKQVFSSGRFNLFHLYHTSQVFSNLSKMLYPQFSLNYYIMMQISEQNQNITIKHAKNLGRQIPNTGNSFSKWAPILFQIALDPQKFGSF